jgi:hypothetical protein
LINIEKDRIECVIREWICSDGTEGRERFSNEPKRLGNRRKISEFQFIIPILLLRIKDAKIIQSKKCHYKVRI